MVYYVFCHFGLFVVVVEYPVLNSIIFISSLYTYTVQHLLSLFFLVFLPYFSYVLSFVQLAKKIIASRFIFFYTSCLFNLHTTLPSVK